jgi:phospholipid transport system substrate-binding protein
MRDKNSKDKKGCMIRFPVAFWQVTAITVLVLHGSAWASESPLAVIRATVERAVTVLQDPAYQEADRRQARLARVRAILLPLFDSQELAKRSLGTHWRDRTEDEKKEFVQLFTELVEQSYSHTLDRYTIDVQFFFDHERIEGDFAEVNTRILDPSQSKPFSINYRLHQVGGKWLIYDIVIENVSMVRNYRNQFHRILSKSSYKELVQSIKRKLTELNTSPS